MLYTLISWYVHIISSLYISPIFYFNKLKIRHCWAFLMQPPICGTKQIFSIHSTRLNFHLIIPQWDHKFCVYITVCPSWLYAHRFECQQKTRGVKRLFKVQNYSHTWASIIVINGLGLFWLTYCDLAPAFRFSLSLVRSVHH